MNKMIKVKLNGQITIPAKIRKELNINNGDFLKLDREGNKLTITPVNIVEKNDTGSSQA